MNAPTPESILNSQQILSPRKGISFKDVLKKTETNKIFLNKVTANLVLKPSDNETNDNFITLAGILSRITARQSGISAHNYDGGDVVKVKKKRTLFGYLETTIDGSGQPIYKQSSNGPKRNHIEDKLGNIFRQIKIEGLFLRDQTQGFSPIDLVENKPISAVCVFPTNNNFAKENFTFKKNS